MQKSKFRGVVVGTSVGLVAFGTVASAAFLASGELNAPVKTGTVKVMEVKVTVPDELYPGYLEDATLTFTNPNKVPTRVTDVVFDRWDTTTPNLTQYLVAAPALAPAGVNPTNGNIVPLQLLPGETKTVTIADVVGLAANIPNQSTGNTGSVPYQGVNATAVYDVTYVVSNGTEAVAPVAVPKK
ncbi:hypothetical protein [uncultured Cellulomonas sp.]|uniref:hypothetical protein n=1 Tax=uncultured Cellulomonas sp. TaxID=189682 RepID=UPI002619CCB4|nr:hypothetical protein [uncultured Cellulomonas sp.]